MVLHGIRFDQAKLADALRRASVRRAFLFGSILTDGFRADSDIDVLVETDPASPPGILALGGLQMDLSDLLGRTVHVTLLTGIPPAERTGVLANARVLNAA